MEHPNQTVKLGRLRSRLILCMLLLVAAVIISLVYTAAAHKMEQHQQPELAENQDFNPNKSMTAIKRLMQSAAQNTKTRPTDEPVNNPLSWLDSDNKEPVPAPGAAPLAPVQPLAPDPDFKQNYQRYQELTAAPVKPAPAAPAAPDPVALARQQLQQQRAQALLAALSATTDSRATAPEQQRSRSAASAAAAATAPSSAAAVTAERIAAYRSRTESDLIRLNSGTSGYGEAAYYGGIGADGSAGPGTLASAYGAGAYSTGTGLGASYFPGENRNTLSAYSQLASGHDSTTLPYTREAAPTDLILRQGTLIPCVLLSGINSDLPGQVQAQVTEDVFDTPTGRNLLIPRGSKIIGQYASGPLMGQQRLMLAFNRVLYPDGSALNLGSMPGAALDGMAGLNSEVDNHWGRLLGNAVLLGGVTAGISLAVDDKAYDDNGNLTLNGALSQGLGQSLGRVITSVIERNLNVAPTLTVAPGFVFNVTLTRDIRFDQ